MKKRLICGALALLLVLCAGARAMTREELRALYADLPQVQESPYAVLADVTDFETAGAITQAAEECALAYVNFLREVAGLPAVECDPLYDLRAQNACLLLAANDEITHTPDIPEGMPREMYESGREGAGTCNLAQLNWSRDEVLTDGIEYFIRDDGDANLFSLPHRRWLLNPCMGATGFGLARSESGRTYVAMYAVDSGRADAEWDRVCWPAAGAFPVELMRGELAWSISLNEEVYDVAASEISICMTEENSGATFVFQPTEAGDGSCKISREAYGAGVCVIFRPAIADAGIEEYVQNQVWRVSVTGLRAMDGSDASFEYRVEMASLTVQDVANIEISHLTAQLRPGDTLRLSADVIPAYADDLSVTWESDDENVATVDGDGNVTAIGVGTCRVTAQSGNGRYDYCEIAVTD